MRLSPVQCQVPSEAMNKKHVWLSLFTEVLIEFINANEVVDYNRHDTVLKRSDHVLS